MKTEWGFAQLLSLSAFRGDFTASGYLIHDTCAFGAEVFVVNHTSKGECLTVTT
ncbi:hypothetical protein ACSBR2_037295 [Camellia fascicularis]